MAASRACELPTQITVFSSAGCQTVLPHNLFMWNALAACDGSMGGVKFGGSLHVDLFIFERRVGNRARHRIEHNLEQMRNGFELFTRELAEQLFDMLSVGTHH
jgi:hypothetical protein